MNMMNASPMLAPLPGELGALLVSGQPLSPAANLHAIYQVATKLAMYVQSGARGNSCEFALRCNELAGYIDNAFTNGELHPEISKELVILLKQICQGNYDDYSHAGIMVLMVSVKSACKIGCFPRKESEELFAIADQIGKNYCTSGNVNVEPSSCHSTISKIMERFYPKMKLGPILVSIEAKPGYEASAVEFHITKSSHVPDTRAYLLVVQTDNIETSACLISPQQVSFLLNGKGVYQRNCIPKEFGPPMPTDVCSLVRYGTNLLQAVGQFNGHYLIVVAYLSVTSLPKHPALQDYVQPAVTSVGSDSEVPVGPFQVPLNCPIRHISRTPVAIQALPDQSQALGPQQNSSTNLYSMLLSGSSAPHVSLTNPASEDAFNIINRGPAAVNMSARAQSQNPPRASGFLKEFGNQHLQQALNPRPFQPMQSFNTQWPGMQRSGSQAGIAQTAGATTNSQQAWFMTSGLQGNSQAGMVQTGGASSSIQPSRFMAADQASRQSQSSTAQNQTPAAVVQSVSRPKELFSSQPDQNWHPTPRMRGSIDFEECPEAIRKLIIAPTQPVQSSRPQSPPVRLTSKQ